MSCSCNGGKKKTHINQQNGGKAGRCCLSLGGLRSVSMNFLPLNWKKSPVMSHFFPLPLIFSHCPKQTQWTCMFYYATDYAVYGLIVFLELKWWKMRHSKMNLPQKHLVSCQQVCKRQMVRGFTSESWRVSFWKHASLSLSLLLYSGSIQFL